MKAYKELLELDKKSRESLKNFVQRDLVKRIETELSTSGNKVMFRNCYA